MRQQSSNSDRAGTLGRPARAGSSASDSPSRTRRGRKKIPLTPYLFIAPAVIIFALFIVWPALQGFGQSAFTRGILARKDIPALIPKFVGIANYLRLFTDQRFLDAFWKTLLFCVIFVPLTMAGALGLALLLQRRFAGVGIARAFVYWPSMMSPIIVGIAWKWILGYETGILNYILKLVGLVPVPWLVQAGPAFSSVILVSVWAQVGFFMVVFIAGLNAIPDSYYEAASLDGADRRQQFIRITLPLLKPTTLLVLVLITINAFKVYQQVTVLTAGGPGRATVFLVQNIYEEAFTRLNGVGYASAQSVVFFLVMLVLSIIQFKLSREDRS